MSNFELSENFVLFIDFLGSSDAAKNWNKEQIQHFLTLLVQMSFDKSAFNLKRSLPDGEVDYKFELTAETTTFSDHIVISYPTALVKVHGSLIPTLSSQLSDMFLNLILEAILYRVVNIAIKALDVGLLIRGGFTIGKLYHHSGVVFGEGMVDAYNLENKVAVYPRIAVSPQIYSNLPEKSKKILLKDKDGIWHLDYFSRFDDWMESIEKKTPADIQNWRKTSIEKVNAQIKHFEEKEYLNELKKWSWFKDNFIQPAQENHNLFPLTLT